MQLSPGVLASGNRYFFGPTTGEVGHILTLIAPDRFGLQPLNVDLTGYATEQFVSNAIASHTNAADPHPQYLTQTEGDGRYPLVSAGLAQFAPGSTTSDQLRALLSDETGTGAAVFGTGPTFLANGRIEAGPLTPVVFQGPSPWNVTHKISLNEYRSIHDCSGTQQLYLVSGSGGFGFQNGNGLISYTDSGGIQLINGQFSIGNPRDIAFGRTSAGVAEINTNTPGSLAALRIGSPNISTAGLTIGTIASQIASAIRVRNAANSADVFSVLASGDVSIGRQLSAVDGGQVNVRATTSGIAFTVQYGTSTPFRVDFNRVGLGTGNALTWGVDATSPVVGLIGTADTIEINNGTAGQRRDILIRNLTASGTVTAAGGVIFGSPVVGVGAAIFRRGNGLLEVRHTDDSNPAFFAVGNIFCNSNSNALQLGSTTELHFCSGTNPQSHGQDAAITRVSPALIRVTNGLSGYGSLEVGSPNISTAGLTIGTIVSQIASAIRVRNTANADVFSVLASGDVSTGNITLGNTITFTTGSVTTYPCGLISGTGFGNPNFGNSSGPDMPGLTLRAVGFGNAADYNAPIVFEGNGGRRFHVFGGCSGNSSEASHYGLAWVSDGGTRYCHAEIGSFVNNTAGSQTGRLQVGVYNVLTFQEGLRFEANVGGVRAGFLGATPVARQTLAADATDLASAITLINDLKSKLIAFGFCQ